MDVQLFLEDAQRLVAIPSVSTEGNEAVAHFFAGYMQERGMKTQIQQVSHSHDFSRRQFNVIGVYGDPLVDQKTRKGLLFFNAIDTSHPGPRRLWKGDPFQLRFQEDTLLGLGVSGPKLDLLCRLSAIAQLRDRKLKEPIYVVGACGQMVGMLGARYLIQSRALHPQAVLVGSPTSGQLLGQTKAQEQLLLRISFHAPERDSKGFSRKILLACVSLEKSEKPVIELLGSVLASLDAAEIEFRLELMSCGTAASPIPRTAEATLYVRTKDFEKSKNCLRSFLLKEQLEDEVTVDFGGIGGVGVCFIPDEALKLLRAMLSAIRLAKTTHTDIDAKIKWIQSSPGQLLLEATLDGATLQDIDPVKVSFTEQVAHFQRQYPRLTLKFGSVHKLPELRIDQTEPFFDQTSALLESEKKSDALASANEASLFAAKGYPALAFGPGLPSNGQEESVTLQKVKSAYHFYRHLAKSMIL